MKLKIKLLKKKLFYIIYCLALLIVSYFLNRLLQMLMFILFFNFIQDCFVKRFHADTIIKEPIKAIKYCKIITIIVQIIYLIFCKNLNTTIYSNLFIIFSIAFLNCLLEFVLSRMVESYFTLNNEDYLMELCDKYKITKSAKDRLIMRYVHRKSIKEIAAIESVDESTIKQSLRRTKRTLGIP